MKKLGLLAMVVVVAGGAWFALPARKLPLGKNDSVPERYVARAEKRDIDFSVEVTGDVTPDFQLDVKPEVGGKLKLLKVVPGQKLNKGDLLCEIDDTDLMTDRKSAMTEIDGAKLAVDRNRRNFERSRDLFASKLISREVFDNLTSDYEIAQNTLAKSQRRLEAVDDKLRKTKILSPMDGTALDVKVIEGQVVVAAASVNSGTSLMTIADLSRLLVDTHVNQVDVAKLQVDQKVKLNTDSLKDAEMDATINFIAPVASVRNNIKGFAVQALIERPDPRLRPGMTVNMTVPIATAPEAVSVPIAAVFKGQEPNSKVVYVKHGESTEKRPVQVGVSNLDFAEIKSGIEAGEEILLIEPRLLQKKS